MSKAKQYIELNAPDAGNIETLRVSDVICPYCHGNGHSWASDGAGDTLLAECPRCAGNGTLTANITIEWKKQPKS